MNTYFVLAERPHPADKTSFLVEDMSAADAFHQATLEIARRVEKAGLSDLGKYVIIDLKVVE